MGVDTLGIIAQNFVNIYQGLITLAQRQIDTGKSVFCLDNARVSRILVQGQAAAPREVLQVARAVSADAIVITKPSIATMSEVYA